MPSNVIFVIETSEWLVCFMCPRADKKNQTKVACMDSGVWMQKKAEAQ